MGQILEIMFPALVACLILTGIHTYLGLHVVSRGVIFVDLALAQIAALGSTFAFLLGFDPSSQTGYFYSLAFTFLGAAIFSLTRLKDQRIPQEALIGIVFAVSSSAAILIADRAPQGAEHVEEMLTGAILWVTWPTIWKTFLIYSAIGVFHLLLRRKFLLISMNPAEAERQGLVVRWWDFLFYMSFGFVITSSVAMAGILLVFSFLIVPSVIGMLFSRKIGPRLIIGWLSGTLVSTVGLYLSYQFDFPSGPSIVCTFGGFLILAGVLRYILQAEHKPLALTRVGAGALTAVLLLFLVTNIRPARQEMHAAEQTETERVVAALNDLRTEDAAAEEALAFLERNQETFSQAFASGKLNLNQETVQKIGEIGSAETIPLLQVICAQTEDPWMLFYAASSMIKLGEKEGVHYLVQLLKKSSPPFLKMQVRNLLREVTDQNFGYEPLKSPEANEESIHQWEEWWHENRSQLRWDPETSRFRPEN